MDTPFKAYEGNEPYVFICYAHDDEDLVYPELSRMHSAGCNIWFDEGIAPGSEWSDALARHIRDCASFVYFVTPRSIASEPCRREVNFLLNLQRPGALLAVHLEPTELPDGLVLSLSNRQAIMKHEHPDAVYAAKLIDAIRRVLPLSQQAAARASMIPDGAPALEQPDDEVSTRVAKAAPSVAVLPFANLSGDPENEYFSDGVAEEILNALANVPELKVAARTSAFSFKGKNLEIKQIGQALNVDHVLEGSVRRSGDLVRVHVQLIDARGGFAMWSNSFDGTLDDIFAVQDEIAAAVAGALQVELAGSAIAGSTTAITGAYNAVLKGRYLMTYGNPESVNTAVGYFKHAVDLDPDYGAAYGELALCFALNSPYTPLSEIASDWQAAFVRALQINPNDVNALAAKALHVTLTQWDWRQAGALYRQAIDFGISSKAALLYGSMFLAPIGKWVEVQSLYAEVLNTDPYNMEVYWDLAMFAVEMNKPEHSLQMWERFLAVESDSADGRLGKALTLAMTGDHDAARAALDGVMTERLNPYLWQYYVWALRIMEDDEGASRVLREYEDLAERDPRFRVGLSWVYSRAGEIEKCLAGLEAMYDEVPWALIFFRNSMGRPLMGQPRYDALLRKIKLDDASLTEAGLL